ncbi:hypothetical protein C770_GR4pC1093 (plasmid) [Sinorhizobium meliloti GR4]|nr:hypothetical protein C770_GR4pC1093 [Sinorhizobium meliloti GR4]
MAELTTTDMALLDRVAAGSVSPGRVMNTAPSPISDKGPRVIKVRRGLPAARPLRPQD